MTDDVQFTDNTKSAENEDNNDAGGIEPTKPNNNTKLKAPYKVGESKIAYNPILVKANKLSDGNNSYKKKEDTWAVAYSYHYLF